MFEESGTKLKSLAYVMAVLGVIGTLGAAFRFKGESVLFSLIIIAAGLIATYCSVLVYFAIGDAEENARAAKEHLNRLQKLEETTRANAERLEQIQQLITKNSAASQDILNAISQLAVPSKATDEDMNTNAVNSENSAPEAAAPEISQATAEEPDATPAETVSEISQATEKPVEQSKAKALKDELEYAVRFKTPSGTRHYLNKLLPGLGASDKALLSRILSNSDSALNTAIEEEIKKL